MSALAWVIVGWLGLNVAVLVVALLTARDDDDVHDMLDRWRQ